MEFTYKFTVSVSDEATAQKVMTALKTLAKKVNPSDLEKIAKAIDKDGTLIQSALAFLG